MGRGYLEEGWAFEDFVNGYRNWIAAEMRADGYGILFDVLFDTPFTWCADVPRDEDRAANGQWLRLRFSNETGVAVKDKWLEIECSFLEFLVALSYSIEDKIMYDPDHPDRAHEWFWMMMGNAGLDEFDDERMMRSGILAFQTVGEVVDRILKRRYEANGYLGLFPLRKPSCDQRNVEIWYQANEYMAENYFD